MTLDDRINSLNDAAAEVILQRFARSQPPAGVPTAMDAWLAGQLGGLVGVEAAASVSKGALARAALLLLSRDPDHAAGVADLLDNPAPQTYAVVETALLVSAVLIVLQMHVRFERDKVGKWSLKLEKKPTDSALLKDLVRKLISFG